MSAIGFGDELVRDYLVFRGFLSTLKALDNEIKADKDRQFRPDRIVEHLSSCVINLELTALREAWAHLDQRFFARLEHSFIGTSKKLENALLRMYLVTCVSSGRHDKMLEFFEKMTPDLQGQQEWKEWFAFPFMKSPEEHPSFAVYFTRQWQDTMLLSLHNFMSVVFQSAAMPALLSYEDDLMKIQNLIEENEILKKKVEALEAGILFESPKLNKISENQVFGTDMMDDFFVIAQESPAETSGRSLRSLIRNISGGLPTSPNLGRKSTDIRKQDEALTSSLKQRKVKPRSPSVPPRPSSTLSVLEASHPKKDKPEPDQSQLEKQTKSSPQAKVQSVSQSSTSSMSSAYDPKGGFIILSREKYGEHNSLITHCKFNCSGTIVASSDMDGVIKIWNATPSLSTMSTIMSKTSVLSLEWASKREKLMLYGGTNGIVRLYDTKERMVIKEVFTDDSGISNQKVLQICCNPLGNSFVASSESAGVGHLGLWDFKTMGLERYLPMLSNSTVAYCSSFNHNGQLLLVGTSDGTSCILDLRTSENIATWNASTSSVLCTQFSADETFCYTLSADGKFTTWSINKTGCKISDLSLHREAVGCTEPGPHGLRPLGKLFSFINEGNYVLTCGPLGGIVYRVSESSIYSALDIGGHSRPVNTVDWSAAMECSTCICGTVDGRVIVSTLLNQ